MSNGPDIIRQRPVSFQGLSERELSELYGLATIRRLRKGEVLIREGAADRVFYVILEGAINIWRDQAGAPQDIALLKEGDWVGEIAFLQGLPRTATAQAAVPSRVMVIDQATLEALAPTTQLFFYRRMSDLAARRIEELSEREEKLTGQASSLVQYIETNRHREVSELLQSDVVQGIISRYPKLPPASLALSKDLLTDKLSVNEAAERIRSINVLSDLVIRRVNSPLFGFKQDSPDIHQALVAIGAYSACLLVIAEGLRRITPDDDRFRAMHDRHMALAHVAVHLSQETRLGRPAACAVLSLLHDVGVGVIELLKDRNPQLSPLIGALDPSRVGSMLLKSWELPEWACASVALQHQPEFTPPPRLPDNVRENVMVLYLSQVFLAVLEGQPDAEIPKVFLADYADSLGWHDADPRVLLESRLLPALKKRLNTFPASFRSLVQQYKPVVP